MGYNTDFDGQFKITPKLSDDQVKELNKYCENSGNTSARGWCDWYFRQGDDCTFMEWNGSEKSYDMDKWARKLVSEKIPSDRSLTGVVLARGEEFRDMWHMVANGRTITVGRGWPGEDE